MVATDAPKGKPVVVVDDVHVIYKVFGTGKKAKAVNGTQAKKARMREVHAVKGVSFVVYEGETIGIVGSNGSGKSSLMRAIAGLYPSTTGAVYTLGKPTMLGVGAALLPNLSGEKNIMLGGLALGYDKKEIVAASQSIIDFSGLKDFIDLPMRTYSSGMSMRLAFAVATSVDADIILMDEWLSVGDTSFMSKAKQRLTHMVDNARLVVIASHDHSLIEDQCNIVLHLEHGKIVSFDRK